MTGPFNTLLVGCLLSMTLGISPAKASSGRIVFSGAVVAPTCSANTARPVAPQPYASSQRPASGEFVCLDANGTADMARAYSRTKVRLDAIDAAGNRLLSYFAGYESGDGAGVTLVTHTFI